MQNKTQNTQDPRIGDKDPETRRIRAPVGPPDSHASAEIFPFGGGGVGSLSSLLEEDGEKGREQRAASVGKGNRRVQGAEAGRQGHRR